MPERRRLGQRLEAEARGREAIHAAAPPAPQTVDRPRSGANWEDSHRRVTFYCPTALLELIVREMARSSRSKTRVITDALRDHLQSPSS